jgi:hypothetical protein
MRTTVTAARQRKSPIGISFQQVLLEDKELLSRIFKLRVTCRQEQGYITPEKYPNGWFDAADDIATHFAVFANDRLIGAARMNFYSSITDHVYFDYFDGLKGYPENERIAYLSRIVVLPEYRLNGVSKSLVFLRESHAASHGVKHVLTDVCDFQIRNFENYGYKNLGMLHSEKIHWEVKPEDYFLMYKKLK